MTDPQLAPEVTIWTSGASAPIFADVLQEMQGSVRPLAVGGERTGAVADLAKKLDVPDLDDLRKVRVEHPAAFVLLGTAAGVEAEDLLAMTMAGTTVLSLEPVAATLQDLAHLRGESGRRRARVEAGSPSPGHILTVPQFLSCPGFRRASDPHDALGDRRVLTVRHLGGPGQGSLYARLFDAWLTVLSFATLPESIDASLTGPDSSLPEDIRQIRGHVSAHGRLSDGGAVLLEVSGQAAQRHRLLHVMGSQAQLEVDDTGYQLLQADGSPLDSADADPTPPGYARLIANQWRRLIDRPHDPEIALQNERCPAALACCHACLLSARTLQPESPRRILEINR